MARLWKSLSTVRVAFIDLRHITPNLKAEIELSLKCFGLERMIFVCDAKSVDQSLSKIAAETGYSIKILRDRTVVWRGGDYTDMERFMVDVEALKQSLPAEPADIRWDTFGFVRDQAMDRRTALRRMITDGVQWAIGIAVVLYLQLADAQTLGHGMAVAMNSPFVRIAAGTLSGFVIVPAVFAMFALFRRRPLERAVRRRSRGVLLRSLAGTTRTLTVASFAVGLGFQLALEDLRLVAQDMAADARIAQARSQIHRLQAEVQLYHLEVGRYPSSLNDLTEFQLNPNRSIDPGATSLSSMPRQLNRVSGHGVPTVYRGLTMIFTSNREEQSRRGLTGSHRKWTNFGGFNSYVVNGTCTVVRDLNDGDVERRLLENYSRSTASEESATV